MMLAEAAQKKTDVCFVVRDYNGQALAYVHYDEQPRKMVACHRQSC
jgi:hypothetical protein